MQRIYVLTTITVGLSADLLLAQSDSDYRAWMKSNAANMGSLNKNIAAKENMAAAEDAKKLEDTFKQVEDSWEKRHVADAVNFAKRAQSAAASAAKSATAGDMEQASADAKTLAMACAACHMAHREKPMPDSR